jgi:hypothetical protein
MKMIAYLMPLALLAACATTGGIKTLKATDESTAVTNCDTCVDVRIKNSGPDNISSITITNSHGEEYAFDGIKAGKVSGYKKFRSMCSCGYTVSVSYFRTEQDKTTAVAKCQNILPCSDFFKGKLTIDINTPKLDEPFQKRVMPEVSFRKD